MKQDIWQKNLAHRMQHPEQYYVIWGFNYISKDIRPSKAMCELICDRPAFLAVAKEYYKIILREA